MCSSPKVKVPPPPPPPPKLADRGILKERDRQRAQSRISGGRQGTILTGAAGLGGTQSGGVATNILSGS